MQSSLALVLLLAICAAGSPTGDLRVIRFNESSEVMLSPEEVDELASANVKFMDITESKGLTPLPTLNTTFVYPKQPTQKLAVTELIQNISTNNMLANLETLTGFYTRYYKSNTGVAAAEFIYDTCGFYKGSHPNITVSYFTNTFPQPSVIARIQGSNSNNTVILGAHLDSIGSTSTGRSPGADDDGSGSVTVLEVFRVLASSSFVPQNTLEFHFYAAEEVGLLGSQAIAKAYQQQGRIVVGMMQLDMTMYADYSGTKVIAMITDYVSNSLTAFVRLLVDAYSLLEWSNSKCGYGCSDHASWTAAGYQSAFPFESPFSQSNPNIHSPQDTIDKLSLTHGLEFAKLGLAHMVELSVVQPPSVAATQQAPQPAASNVQA